MILFTKGKGGRTYARAISRSQWGLWGAWSGCSKTCGSGRQSRWRMCPSNAQCQGQSSETQQCSTTACQGKLRKDRLRFIFNFKRKLTAYFWDLNYLSELGRPEDPGESFSNLYTVRHPSKSTISILESSSSIDISIISFDDVFNV